LYLSVCQGLGIVVMGLVYTKVVENWLLSYWIWWRLGPVCCCSLRSSPEFMIPFSINFTFIDCLGTKAV
jgi:hypothetical protein